MKQHPVRVYKSEEHLPRQGQLAWKIAEVAADPVEVTDDVTEMVINRVIDNAAVAAASIVRAPGIAARSQAERHPFAPGSTVFGIDGHFSPEWAAWANGVAVRELDFHDTFLAAEYSHPGDNIPPILAVAQHADPAEISRHLDAACGAAEEMGVAPVAAIARSLGPGASV